MIGREALCVAKVAARQGRKWHPTLIILGGVDFYLRRHGTSSGYPFRFENVGYSTGYVELNMPSFFVKFRSEAPYGPVSQFPYAPNGRSS